MNKVKSTHGLDKKDNKMGEKFNNLPEKFSKEIDSETEKRQMEILELKKCDKSNKSIIGRQDKVE